MRSRETLGLLLGLIGVVIFGGTLPMTRLAVFALDPWFLTVGRAALAGAIAGSVFLVLRRPLPPRAVWGELALVSLLLVGGFPGFSGLAMATVPAAHGGVVIGLLPLATAVVSAVVMGERPSLGFWLCGLAGAILVVIFTLRHGGAGGFAAGDLLLLAAVAAAAIGYTLSGRLSRLMPGWEVISWAVIIALPVTLPMSYLLFPATPSDIPLRIWAAFSYLGVMSMYLGFFFWNTGLAMGGVARVSQVQLIQPFVTLAIAATLLGEHIDGETLVFAVAVVLVVLAGRRMRVSASQKNVERTPS